MVKELTAQNFEAALKENKTAVVEFYSKTSRHCKKLEAGIQELSEELGDSVFFGKVEIPAEIFLAEEYEVGSVPALLYFKDGQLRERSLGFVHKLIIAENIKKL